VELPELKQQATTTFHALSHPDRSKQQLADLFDCDE
jgi:hypothetical protein